MTVTSADGMLNVNLGGEVSSTKKDDLTVFWVRWEDRRELLKEAGVQVEIVLVYRGVVSEPINCKDD